MSVHVLERNVLYSKEIGAEISLVETKPPIEEGKELVLVSWNYEGNVELQVLRPSAERELLKCKYAKGTHSPWRYCYGIIGKSNQGVFLDWAKEHHKLDHYHGAAEHILQRVVDYDGQSSPLHGGLCLKRLEELRNEVFKLDLDWQEFHRIDSILLRAQRKLTGLLEWQRFVVDYCKLARSNKVDEQASIRLMKHATHAIAISCKSIYIGLVSIGETTTVLCCTSRPIEGVIYESKEAEVGLHCKTTLTNLVVGKEPPRGSLVLRTISGTNEEQQLWMAPKPFGIRCLKSFSSSKNVSVHLVDAPAAMFVGDIQKEVMKNS